MRALRFLFWPSGRLRPRAFVPIAAGVYAAGLAAQYLTTRDVIAHAGLWPFALVQALLIWMWFVVHARRLHDAARSSGVAAGASVLYALAVVLLLLLAGAFLDFLTPPTNDPNATSALGVLLLLAIIAVLAGSLKYDLVWFVIAILTGFAVVPIVVSLAVTLWTAAQPSAATPAK